MTNQQKAEACGEYVRGGLDALTDYRYIGIAGLIIESFLEEQDLVVRGARRAGHWGRLALAEPCLAEDCHDRTTSTTGRPERQD